MVCFTLAAVKWSLKERARQGPVNIRKGEQYCTANHMCDLHEVVVHNVGEVVGRKAVALHDNKMVFGEFFPVETVHDIMDSGRAKATAKSNSVCLASRGSFRRLVGRDRQAHPRICAEYAIRLQGLVVVGGHVVVGAEATERFTLLQKTVHVLLVDVKALRL